VSLSSKRVDAVIGPSPDDAGEFDVILSNATEDRDGEVLLPEQWKQPLPGQVQFNVDHSGKVSDIVGSGVPWIDEAGNLRVRGKFAISDLGQHIRGLVNEGHLMHVSVEFLRSKDANGNSLHELVGGSFVTVPSNPNARVLASKASNGDAALITAIHDASVHLGAQCVVMEPDYDPDSGASDGANRAVGREVELKDFQLRLDAILAGRGDPGPMDHDGANKAQALKLRLKSICA
jgi:hypothetical protein